jgi:hypothetical protein
MTNWVLYSDEIWRPDSQGNEAMEEVRGSSLWIYLKCLGFHPQHFVDTGMTQA